MKISLELAQSNHAQAICDLVNLAYRGEAGWTRKTDLVAGERCALVEVDKYICNPQSHVLIAFEQQELIACICLELQQDSAYIGLFSVDPRLQGVGIGKRVLSLAEDYAQKVLKADKCSMVVVSQRMS
ncbi:MAG: hypothetical protein ISEC1_P1681 [Thiomicrorhabdus sp.]|nr:MAG: hypothetical protein ISEC1_P1681 [Thiomicrorhabdus sp.]